jgi:uncharacterized protein YeaO (DUF488 family)
VASRSIQDGEAVHAFFRRGRPLILTVGHSTRHRKEFIRLLRANGVRLLADVRTIPRSRHNPQFNRAVLSHALRRAGIRYRHMPGLGGLRHAQRDSINTGWRNMSFRGYADYMETPDFRIALQKLIALARQKRAALMCAEAVPWRCHRLLIADALLARGFPVEEIQSATRTRRHTLTPWARIKGTRITYPPGLATTKPRVAAGGSERRTKMIQLKRIYDKASADDGKRFLIERLWPRGIKKTALRLDAWLKEVGPSTTLRQWFGHEPKRWEEFRHRYFSELDRNADAWAPILKAARQGRVTLLFSSHDTEHNNAVALKEYLEFKMRGEKAVEGSMHNILGKRSNPIWPSKRIRVQ